MNKIEINKEMVNKNTHLYDIIFGIFLGGIAYIIISIILTMIGPSPGGIHGILATPRYPPNFIPSYSAAIFRSMHTFIIAWSIIGGVYVGSYISFYKKAIKSHEYYEARRMFLTILFSSLLWLVITIIFYFFKIDIGEHGAKIGVLGALFAGIIFSCKRWIVTFVCGALYVFMILIYVIIVVL